MFQTQEEADMHFHFTNVSDTVVFLPTDASISLTYLEPAFLCPLKLCFIVLPIDVFQHDLVPRCKRGGVADVYWKDRGNA